MCKFCDLLYSEKQADKKLHNEGAADLIYYDDNGEINIQVDTGDPWESGILSNVTYCPYCGRNLKELYGPFIECELKEKKKLSVELDYGVKEADFHCGIEESGGHAYNCNDCPNKCEEYYQWDKEMKKETEPHRAFYPGYDLGFNVGNDEKEESDDKDN